MDAWEKSPQPFWYNDPVFPWFALMGEFVNTSNGSPDHIENMDGKQAAYLFALLDVAIFQDYISIGGTETAPTHDFDLKYEVGNSYNLTVGLLGGGGGMSNGATFEISFYYRDDASNKVTVATTTITNSETLFPTRTHFTDFNAQVPTVKGGEAWAGKHVGVQLASTTSFDLTGGYWDVDNLRIRIVRDPVLRDGAVNTGAQFFQFNLQAALGIYEILSSSDLANWSRLGVVTNSTGSISVLDVNLNNRFYKARTAP